MRDIRLAVVGLGEFAVRHLDVLAHLPGVELRALVSRSQERAAALAERYRVPHYYDSVEAMLADTEVDAVDVITEDTRHLAPVLAALRHGADVFVEKPLSTDLAEAREMIDEATRLGRRLMVGHILRFDTRCAAVKQQIEDGQMGRVATVYGRRNSPRRFQQQYHLANRLFTTGIHDIDLVLWYFAGRRPVEVYMKTMQVMEQGDDVFWGIITMDDGSLGIIESNWLLPDATPWSGHVLLEVIGTKGTALAEVPGNGLSFWFDDRVQVPDVVYWPHVHGATVGALRDELAYFVRCVAEGRPIEMPVPEDAYRSLAVAHALLRSSAAGRPVSLTPAPEPAAVVAPRSVP